MSNSPECNIDRLSDALDGLLDDHEMAELQQHLEKCASCAKAYAELNQVSSQLKALPSIAVPQDFIQDVRQSLRSEMASQQRKGRVLGWLSVTPLFQWRTLALAGTACLAAILILWGPAWNTSPQSSMVALELNTSEEVAGLDVELAFSQEGTKAGQPAVPTELEDFVVASHTQGLKMRVSMASVQAIRPSGKTRILEMPLTQKAGSASGVECIQVLSVRAYGVDGKPAHAEIKATPMLPTRDSKWNTTA